MEEAGKIKTIVYIEYGQPYWAMVALVKEGSKYIHYKALDDGFSDWHKIEKEKVKVFDGQREDIINKVEEFKKKLRAYEEERQKAIREIEIQLLRERSRLIDEWNKNNPRPEFKI
jgi:hypothetical protein